MSVLPQKFAFYCYSTRERLDQRGGRALAGVTAAYLFACFTVCMQFHRKQVPQGSHCVEISKTNTVQISFVRISIELDYTVSSLHTQVELDSKSVF